tara:strand:+ start:1086 stop:1748 length:663 start_codon:yes stop_codon:yes gene_type:complete
MTHRYYCNQPLAVNTTIELSKEEQRHLKSVMRTKKGDKIEIVNGKGYLAFGEYHDGITITNVTYQDPDSAQKYLALGLSEPKHLEMIIEKGTELGVDEFIIFPSKKSKYKVLSSNKIERLHKILLSSLKQSKRLYLPKITLLTKKEDLSKNQNYLLADFEGKTFKSPSVSTVFIVGPESGFTEDEITFFKEDLKAHSVVLSKNVLRCETAAICAATLLSI